MGLGLLSFGIMLIIKRKLINLWEKLKLKIRRFVKIVAHYSKFSPFEDNFIPAFFLLFALWGAVRSFPEVISQNTVSQRIFASRKFPRTTVYQKVIFPGGSFPEGQFPRRTVSQKDSLPEGQFPRRTFSQKDSLPELSFCFWENTLLGNYASGKLSFWETVVLGNCCLGNWPSGKLPTGKKPTRKNPLGNYLWKTS